MRKLRVEQLEIRDMLTLGFGITDLTSAGIETRQGGHWENPATWEGFQVPGTGDVAIVKQEHVVVVVNGPDVDVKGIGVHGVMFTLNNTISVKDWLVYEEGTLINGPGSRTTFKDQPASDPDESGTGLIVFGTWYAWGHYKTPHVRTTHDLNQGSSQVILGEIPQNWQPNDALILPETNQTRVFRNQPMQTLRESEVVRVGQLDGENLALDRGTRYAHPGMVDNSWGEERYAHVANISRDTVFRSESTAQTRGHVIVAGPDAVAHVESVSFTSLGRTKATEPVGPNNIAGRYSLHLHKMGDGGQNVSLRNNVVGWGLKWGITVHGTNGATIENNVVYAMDGAGIATEDASETNNAFRGNLVVRVDGGWQTGDERAGANNFGNGVVDTGSEGSGFWFRGPANYVEGNFVYDAAGYAYNYNGYYTDSDNTVPVNTIRPVLQFKDNEAASSFGGLWLSWSQACCDINAFQPSLFDGFVAWHNSDQAVKAYHESENTFRNFLIVADSAVSSTNEGTPWYLRDRSTVGFDFGTINYENWFTTVEGARVSGTNTGLLGSPSAGPTGMQIRDSIFANYINIGYEDGASIYQHHLDNITFLPTEVDRINWPLYPACQADIWNHGSVVDPGVCN